MPRIGGRGVLVVGGLKSLGVPVGMSGASFGSFGTTTSGGACSICSGAGGGMDSIVPVISIG
jgi:hypothetical protein